MKTVFMNAEECNVVNGYFVCVKENGKKVVFKVSFSDQYDMVAITTNDIFSSSTVMRRVFGWR